MSRKNGNGLTMNKRTTKEVAEHPTPRLASVELVAQLVCRFEDGTSAIATLEALGISAGSPVVRATLDDSKTSIILRHADTSKSSVGADHVLYVNAPDYAPKDERAARGALAKRIASRLRAARSARGYTQAWMAEQLGIAQPNYARMESGRHVPDVEALLVLGRVLGVPMHYFTSKEPLAPVRQQASERQSRPTQQAPATPRGRRSAEGRTLSPGPLHGPR